MLGLFIVFCVIVSIVAIKEEKEKREKLISGKQCCPRCKSLSYYVVVSQRVVSPQKVKAKISINLNPLKPFTLFDYRQKVVKAETVVDYSEFVCNDCGHIWQ